MSKSDIKQLIIFASSIILIAVGGFNLVMKFTSGILSLYAIPIGCALLIYFHYLVVLEDTLKKALEDAKLEMDSRFETYLKKLRLTCLSCEGTGLKHDLKTLPGIAVVCSTCKGKGCIAFSDMLFEHRIAVDGVETVYYKTYNLPEPGEELKGDHLPYDDFISLIDKSGLSEK